jgi:hypothetical protein
MEEREQVTRIGIVRVNGQPEELDGPDGRRQPSVGGTSRISREAYVRICERLGVQFPGATRRSAGNRRPYADQTGLPYFDQLYGLQRGHSPEPSFATNLPGEHVLRCYYLAFSARSKKNHRCPSRSSTRYRRPGGPLSISDRIVAPAALERAKCASRSST